MAFRFRLEKVLNFREKIVEQKSREVGAAARALALINSRIETLQDEIQALISGPQGPSDALDIRSLDQRRGWLDHLEKQLISQQREQAAASQELELRRTKLTEAWRDVEILKKLKERQKMVWQEEQLRRENQDLDEIGQIRADRRNREILALNQA